MHLSLDPIDIGVVLEEPGMSQNDRDTAELSDKEREWFDVPLVVRDEVDSVRDRPCFIPCPIDVMDSNRAGKGNLREALFADEVDVDKAPHGTTVKEGSGSNKAQGGGGLQL